MKICVILIVALIGYGSTNEDVSANEHASEDEGVSVNEEIEDGPEAEISLGKLRGTWMTSREGRDIEAFEGIPYAAPPVDSLRFKAPRPPTPWEGVLNATEPGSPCAQRDTIFQGLMSDVFGEEDCLFINVYKPKEIKEGKKLDVLFYIHGGGFISGAGHVHQPNYLLDNDVVFVSVNYRLGPLGFLTTMDDVLPGNLGLKDIVQALQWVKDNIAAFGGNPNNVMIFGESAGAVAVHLLTLSPSAKGLFHKAIAQSGNAIISGVMGSEDSALGSAALLAEFLDCPATPTEDFRNCLLKKSKDEIVNVDRFLKKKGAFDATPFKPVVESGEGAFLDRDPLELLTSTGPVSDVPFMTGLTSHEGCIVVVGIYSNETSLKDFDEQFDSVFPYITNIDHAPQALIEDITTQARRFYYGNKRITNDTKLATVNFFTDFLFLWPTKKAVQLHLKSGKSDVFFYEFAHLSARSFSQLLGSKGNDYGVCHGDDLIHLFPLEEMFPDAEPTVEDEKMSKKLIELFVSFSKTGKPTGDDSWKKVSNLEEPEYLKIGPNGEVAMHANPAPKRMKFWDEFDLNVRSKATGHDEL